MMSQAVHFKPQHRYEKTKPAPVIVTRQIDGHEVTATGRMVERNSLDGWVWSACVTWKVDGKRVNKTQLYIQFRERCK
jgi:hypothetical protein